MVLIFFFCRWHRNFLTRLSEHIEVWEVSILFWYVIWFQLLPLVKASNCFEYIYTVKKLDEFSRTKFLIQNNVDKILLTNCFPNWCQFWQYWNDKFHFKYLYFNLRMSVKEILPTVGECLMASIINVKMASQLIAIEIVKKWKYFSHRKSLKGKLSLKKDICLLW